MSQTTDAEEVLASCLRLKMLRYSIDFFAFCFALKWCLWAIPLTASPDPFIALTAMLVTSHWFAASVDDLMMIIVRRLAGDDV